MCGETPVRYVYDGSFEGLLCCVYESVYSHMLPQEVVCEADAQPACLAKWLCAPSRKRPRACLPLLRGK